MRNFVKIFGKIILKPLQFRKGLSSPRMIEHIQIVWRSLECICEGLKVRWIV